MKNRIFLLTAFWVMFSSPTYAQTWTNVSPGWNATSITAGGMAVYEANFYVGAYNTVGPAQVWQFEGPVYPEQGTMGTEITVKGSGFGAAKGKVLVGNVSLKILEWTDSSIRCQLSKSPPLGTYDVTIQPKGVSETILSDGFTIVAPEIDSIEPSSGSAGDEITINGFFSGTKKGKITLDGKNCKVVSWTMVPVTGDSEIRFIVPKRLTPGTYELKMTNGLGSDTMNFTVESAITKAILAIFEDISQIPRCSKHEEGISAWLVDWARKHKLPVIRDEFNNVLITVPATRGSEHREAIVLQAHMDMVCQKTPDSLHDFTKDPIVLIREGDWLRAQDTTLGADDGIGIAIALAIADYPAIDHPKLEILITTDEEVDMTGAAGLSATLLTGRKYINLDSEDEGVITLGAAGGIKSNLSDPLVFSPLPQDRAVFSLKISGLLGGHSGVDINKGRANANYLVAQALAGTIPLRVIDFAGGTADNVITDSSEMLFAISPDDVGALQTRIYQFEQETRDQYPTETGMAVSLTELTNTAQLAASEDDSAGALSLIASLPQGVYEWSTAFSGLPETSNNIGIVQTGTAALNATTFARSFNTAKLESIASLIEATAFAYGGSAVRRSAFPTWPPNTDSALYETFLESYQDLFNTPMTSEVIHAGLECGYIAEKYPEMEIVSIGPTLEDVHSTKERLYIPSLEKIVKLLAEVMGRP